MSERYITVPPDGIEGVATCWTPSIAAYHRRTNIGRFTAHPHRNEGAAIPLLK
jgi:hypothetical protein